MWHFMQNGYVMKTLRGVHLPQTVVDLIPECVARESHVIAVALHDEVLTVACPVETFSIKDAVRVESILARKIHWLHVPRDEISEAINRHYVVDGSIVECGWEFRFRCPQRWRDLAPTNDESVRFCCVCSRNVYACHNESMVQEHSSQGRCVAIMQDSFGGYELIGDVAL